MRYEPEHKHASRSKTVLINAAVAGVAILSLMQEHSAALHIPSDWLARISFAGAVLTILLRRFTYARPIRFRRRRQQGSEGRYSEPGADELGMDVPTFI